MVSIISMPATVAALSLPSFWILTRVTLMRMWAMIWDMIRFISVAVSPTSVSSQLYLSMTTR